MKKNIRKSIVVGVCTAAILSQQVLAFAGSTPSSSQVATPMSSSEQAFANKLSGNAKDVFMKMSSKDRAHAMQTEHSCKAMNTCKGKGGYKTDANKCKGDNACKQSGACKVTANDAVMMTKKRVNV